MPALARHEVPVLKPIVSVQLYSEPITGAAPRVKVTFAVCSRPLVHAGLLFMETMLFTINQLGAIKVWKRPDKAHATCV